ncbi:MAG: hypothetical protein QFX34_02515 [Candidatus Verstraetearchaeota archaeon]|nr:hypothetical protein [Candidatus Verstraetearchaeota archaeon]
MKTAKRGVSEVVATLALLVITLTAMAIYIQGFNLYYSGETGLLSGIFRSGSEQNYERISIIYTFKNGTGSDAALYVLVCNYGARNATIEKVIIDTVVQSYSPQVVPVGDVTALRIPLASTSMSENVAHVISLITERNNVISAEFRV